MINFNRNPPNSYNPPQLSPNWAVRWEGDKNSKKWGEINKAPYFSRFSKKIENKFPSITKTCPYKDSLYTFMTCDFNKGEIRFEEKISEYIKPSPTDLGIPNSEQMNPLISEMKFKYSKD